MAPFRPIYAILVLLAAPGMLLASDAADPPVAICGEDGRPIVAADDILAYDWPTHTITIRKQRRQELWQELRTTGRLVGGIPFSLYLGDEAIYRGTLTTSASSRSFETPVILFDAVPENNRPSNRLHIRLGYPTEAFFKADDPRADARIRQALDAAGKLTDSRQEHNEWLAEILRELQTIQPGMTREELLKIVVEQGGLSSRTHQHFAHRHSPYIKIEVRFELKSREQPGQSYDPRDKVSKVSAPYLQWSIHD